MRYLELVSGVVLLMMVVAVNQIHAESNEDTSASKIVYDQRQSGKYNIHVSIKDVAIIEMGENQIADETINEEDYYYDDSDLTVKPFKLPTPPQMESTTPTVSTPTIMPDVSDEEIGEHGSSTTHRFTAATTNGLPTNVTYSPNLLADIVATQAAANHHSSNRPSEVTANKSRITNSSHRKTPNIVIMESTKHYNSPTSTHLPPLPLPALLSELRGRTKDIPIQSMVNEPTNQQQFTAPLNSENSRIYKVKVQRDTQPHLPPGATAMTTNRTRSTQASVRRCRANQYRDASGNCRIKRSTSSSFLRKLFSMLVSLPFSSERVHHHYDQPTQTTP